MGVGGTEPGWADGTGQACRNSERKREYVCVGTERREVLMQRDLQVYYYDSR